MFKLHLSLSKVPSESEDFHSQYMSKEFSKLGSFSAANQGPYKVIGYQHNTCEGTIALMPLYRNAEGAVILGRLLNQKEIRKGVILAGEIHPNFPQMSYTIWQIQQSFKRLFNSQYSQAPLLAFAETGHCKLAEKVVNITL
jgi:hypothetical protein